MRKLEMTLLIAVALVFTYAAAAGAEQQEISEQVLRLHVIANSDEEYDQQVKLFVRDRVLEFCAPLLELAEDQREVREILQANMQEIVNVAQAAVWETGADESVLAQMKLEYYPTREYADFALPAGQYVGLRIMIGEAVGQNWWCVVFPPLCDGVASSSSTLTSSQQALTRRDGTQYVVKFKAAEVLAELRHTFGAQ